MGDVESFESSIKTAESQLDTILETSYERKKEIEVLRLRVSELKAQLAGHEELKQRIKKLEKIKSDYEKLVDRLRPIQTKLENNTPSEIPPPPPPPRFGRKSILVADDYSSDSEFDPFETQHNEDAVRIIESRMLV